MKIILAVSTLIFSALSQAPALADDFPQRVKTLSAEANQHVFDGTVVPFGISRTPRVVQEMIALDSGNSVEQYNLKLATLYALRHKKFEVLRAESHLDQAVFGKTEIREWALVPTSFEIRPRNSIETETSCLVHFYYEVSDFIYIGSLSETSHIANVFTDVQSVDFSKLPECSTTKYFS